jgi:hypothetical protein
LRGRDGHVVGVGGVGHPDGVSGDASGRGETRVGTRVEAEGDRGHGEENRVRCPNCVRSVFWQSD